MLFKVDAQLQADQPSAVLLSHNFGWSVPSIIDLMNHLNDYKNQHR